MKQINRLIKSFFILLLVFVFTTTVKAGISCGKSIDITKSTKEYSAHFDVLTSTCTWSEIVGYQSFPLDHYPEKEEVVDFGQDILQDTLERIKNTSLKDSYEQMPSAIALDITRCDAAEASIDTHFDCTVSWGSSHGCNQNTERYYYYDIWSKKYIEGERCKDYTRWCVCGSGLNETVKANGCCKDPCPAGCSEPYSAVDLSRHFAKQIRMAGAINAGTEKARKGKIPIGTMTKTLNNIGGTFDPGFLTDSAGLKWVGEAKSPTNEIFPNSGLSVYHNLYNVHYEPYKEKDVERDCGDYGGDQGGTYKNCDCTTYYVLRCPIYACNPTVTQSGACTSIYRSNSINADMYCVNPTMRFTTTAETNKLGYIDVEQYQIDNSFDFRTCNTSYQSEECGFSNILIESEYAKRKGSTTEKDLLDYQTINLALRLFGGHVSSRGYIESAGLGTKRTIPGTDGSCDWDAFYTFVPSTYKISNSIAMMYLDTITKTYSNDYVSPAMFVNDGTLSFPCAQNRIGALCIVGGNGTIRERKVKVAFGLYYNTVMGNSKMKEHRDELFGYSLNRIQNAELVGEGDSETKSRLVVDYGDIHVDEIETGKVYNCNDLRGINPTAADYIRKYCSVKLVYNYSKGGVTYSSTLKPEYCSGKHSLRCTTGIINVAVCDSNRTSQSVTATYYDEINRGGPIRAVACSVPDQLQYLYGIAGSRETPERSNTETYEITNYECNTTFCHDLKLREKDASVLPPQTKADYDKIKSGDVSTGHIKDPSLKCILNASAENKLKYDYSELFGVNTNFCRVYCSDEVEYYIPDKETIKDGQSLKYDIAIRSYLKEKKDHMISSVVKEKRTCASEIYYNNFPRAINWGSIYGFTLKDQAKVTGYTTTPQGVKQTNGIYNWKQLFDILHSLTGSGSGGVSGEIITENLNEIIYDLYNCNFYSAKGNNNMFEKNNINRPRQRAFGGNEINQNVYDYYIANEFDVKNDYGLVGVANSNDGKCPYDSKSGRLSCMQMRNIEYKGGSEMTNGSNIGGTGINNNIDIDNVSTATLEKVRYCRDAEAATGQCFGYIDNVKNGSPEDLQSYIYERMDDKTTEYTLNKKKKAQVPINDYAILTMVTEVGFFNKTKFQSEPSTGKVSKIENVPDTGRLKVDDYTYPVSKNAFAMCSKESKQGNYYYDEHEIIYPTGYQENNFYKPEEFNNCRVIHSYQNLNTYHRAQFNDNFHSKISNYQAGTYYEVTASQPQCTEKNGKCLKGLLDVGEYRNVNRENIFPFKINYDNSNWDTKEGEKAKNAIEDVNQEIFLDDDYLEYSFELSPAQLNNIKRYNLTAKEYVEVEVDNCELTEDRKYLNCRSVENGLLSEIRKNQSNAANTSYATIIDNHDGSDLFYKKN